MAVGLSNLICPECEANGISFAAKNPAGLGGHRKTVHGVQGKDRSRRRRKPQRVVKFNLYVQWLADHPGTHSTTEIAAALGSEATRVGKTLSASKQRGVSVISDGHGNWHYTGEANLPEVVSNGHKPVNNRHQPPQVVDDEIQIFSVRRAFLLDTSEGLLIAEKLR